VFARSIGSCPVASTRLWPSHGQRCRKLLCVRIPLVLPLPLLLHPADQALLERWRWVVQWRVVRRVVRRREVSAAAWRGAVSYTAAEWRTIEPLARQAAEQAREHPERRDLLLCHAWDDRKGAARELCDLLVSLCATVWFSEKDVGLGKSLLREIDKGLANSRIGIVLVIPALLKSLPAEGIADKELSALLATDRVIPVAHGTTFDALRDVSPLLAARSGLSTGNSSMRDVATKVAAAAAAENDT
jgi:hypothetical protein